jgi:ketosteroid isomerase-like protein
MLRRIAVATVAAVAGVAALVAGKNMLAGGAMDDAAELVRLENETYAAIRDKDAIRFGGLLSPDFVYRAPGQPDTAKAAFLAGIASFPGTIEHIEGEGVKVAIRGDSALVTGVQKVRVRMPDGKVEQGATAFSDLFVKRSGRWVMAAAFGVELPK